MIFLNGRSRNSTRNSNRRVKYTSMMIGTTGTTSCTTIGSTNSVVLPRLYLFLLSTLKLALTIVVPTTTTTTTTFAFVLQPPPPPSRFSLLQQPPFVVQLVSLSPIRTTCTSSTSNRRHSLFATTTTTTTAAAASTSSTHETVVESTTTTTTTPASNTTETRLLSSLTTKPNVSAAATAATTTTTTTTSANAVWYPSRIQDTIDYTNIVSRLFVRHIVTETEALAKTIVQLCTSTTTTTTTTTATPITTVVPSSSLSLSMDPFGDIAKQISGCAATRHVGGTIGWMERPPSSFGGSDSRHSSDTNNTTARDDPIVNDPSTTTTTTTTESTTALVTTTESTTATSHILSNRLVQELYALRPKAGDIYILHDPIQQRYHIVQVTELWINYKQQPNQPSPSSSSSSQQVSSSSDHMMIGSYRGTNQHHIERKNKSYRGHGIRFVYPPQPKTYSIQTSGCQMNVADSERLEGILQHELHLVPLSSTTSTTSSSSKSSNNKNVFADIVLFNTCSIRDHAEQKLYDALGPYTRAKRNGQQRIALIVTGCVAQQEGELLLQRIPEIDAVIGPQYIPYLANIIETISNGQQVVVTAPMLLQDMAVTTATAATMQDQFLQKPIRGHTVRGWVNIIHGCNEHCTYCVVPGTRGMEQSRTMEHILDECVSLQQQGYKEVTLLGQNIDAYGRDMVPKRTFADLLTYLNHNIPDPMRIRYVTSHPRYFSDRVIDAVASLDKVCECFHMPFQAGDDEVLRNMRRGYTYASYMNTIRKIRLIAGDDASICTDIIVGFPGETEEQFVKTLQLMEEVQFDNVNSFVYSPRPNTEAALYTNQIDDSIKRERLSRVQELAVRHGYQRSLRYVNTIVQVLVEDINPRSSIGGGVQSQVMGRTRQGRQVYFNGDIETLLGELVSVKITEARTWSLIGELVQ